MAAKGRTDRANLARNSLKHLKGPHVTLGTKVEAEDMLDRAISNYWLLEKTMTPAMERFQREVIFPR
jgi:hypothetical protein